jgi:hypothetical protein
MIEKLVHFELDLPLDLAKRMEIAVECLGRSSMGTREQFALTAIEWALESLRANNSFTAMGLDIQS